MSAALDARMTEIGAGLPDGIVGAAVYDYRSGFSWSQNGERWFHAASTIKVAVLAAVFDAIDRGSLDFESRVAVRNRFFSAADGLPFRVPASRDSDADVHAAIGRTMRVAELAQHMICSSSNLATNLLLEVVGVEHARAALAIRGIDGVDLQRGVEDDRAYDAGCSNRVTPLGLVRLLRVVREGTGFSEFSTRTMLEILLGQRFAGAIAPGIPEPLRAATRVAHKTGDISTASHDAGIVFPPGRPPYVIALLAEGGRDAAARNAALLAASRAIYEAIAAAGEGSR